MSIRPRSIVRLAPLALLLLLAGCGAPIATDEGGTAGSSRVGTPTAATSELSMEDVYARVAETAARPGQVLHSTARSETEAGLFSNTSLREQWVDVSGNAVREEGVYTFTSSQAKREGARPSRRTTITTSESRVTRHDDGSFTDGDPDSFACYGASASVSALLRCAHPTEESETRAERGEYAGRPAVVLVTTGSTSGSDEREEFTERLYLDARTLLPVAAEREGTLDYGRAVRLRGRTRFEHEWVTAASLPNGYFDAASLGYERPDPVEDLDRAADDLQAYWLGERLEKRGELPALAISNVVDADAGGGEGYELVLEYNLAADRYSRMGVTMEQWNMGVWENAPVRGPWDSPCAKKREIELPAGRATIFSFGEDPKDSSTRGVDAGAEAPAGVTPVMGGKEVSPPGTTPAPGPKCSGRSMGGPFAHVRLGRTLVRIRAHDDLGRRNPYETEAGLERVVRALRPR